MDSSGAGAPIDPGVPSAPSQPAPTGTKWKGVVVTDQCGHTTLAWTVVDEICDGITSVDDLNVLRAPMFRDGAVIGETLFTVDATNLWALDVTNPAAVARRTLIGGLGHPIGAATHGGKLVLAAGERGMLVLDVENPDHPALLHELPLPGYALSVRVTDDRAAVALGEAGVAVVDLAGLGPELLAVHPTPSIAAAGVLGKSHLFVAACDRLLILDPETGEVVATTPLANLSPPGPNRAPIKDVTLVGDHAYVAAGTWGAIAVDVSDPLSPQARGHCMPKVPDEAFYASGVRANDDMLFVAGGEWGVLPVPVSQSGGGCVGWTLPSPAPVEPKKPDCSQDPPWEVVDWESTYSPPPPPPIGKDPIQVLVQPDRVFAFGDAARIGLRAIDIREPKLELDLIGRYQEPRLVTGVAAQNGRLLVLGERGGLFLAQDMPVAAPDGPSESVQATAIAGAFLEDGRWVVASADGKLTLEGDHVLDLPFGVFPAGLTTQGSTVVVPSRDGLVRVDTSSLASSVEFKGWQANLPARAVALSGDVVVAAPEWPRSIRLSAAGMSELDGHGVFGADDVMDANRWRLGVPERLLFSSPTGALIEVASLGGAAGMAVHVGAVSHKLALPGARYVAAAADGTHAVLVTANRATYRSQMVTVRLSPTPAITESIGFMGVATGVAIDAGRVFVADADRGLRVYARQGGGNTALGVLGLGGQP